jgi:VanZ family protein
MRGSRPWRVAAAAWAAIIVLFGVVPVQGLVHTVAEGQAGENLVTWAGHFAEYAILAFVLAVVLDDWRLSLRAIIGAAALAIGLGAAIELVQALLPYRDCQLSDALVNAAGAGLGLALFSVVARRRGRRPRWRRG